MDKFLKKSRSIMAAFTEFCSLKKIPMDEKRISGNAKILANSNYSAEEITAEIELLAKETEFFPDVSKILKNLEVKTGRPQIKTPEFWECTPEAKIALFKSACYKLSRMKMLTVREQQAIEAASRGELGANVNPPTPTEEAPVHPEVVKIFFKKANAWADKNRATQAKNWGGGFKSPSFQLDKTHRGKKNIEYAQRSEKWLREAYQEAGFRYR